MALAGTSFMSSGISTGETVASCVSPKAGELAIKMKPRNEETKFEKRLEFALPSIFRKTDGRFRCRFTASN